MSQQKLSYITTNYNTSIWPIVILAKVLAFHFDKIIGQNFGDSIGEWRNRTNRWAIDQQASIQIAQKTIHKVEKDKKWLTKSLKKIKKSSQDLLDFTSSIFKIDLKTKTNKQLYRLYIEYQKKFIEMYRYGWLPNALEGFNNLFSKKLNKFLEEKLTIINKQKLLGEYFATLTTLPKTTIREKEQIDFYKLLIKIEKKFKNKKFTITPEVDRLFKNHTKKYCWLPFDYEGNAWNKDYFIETAKSLWQNKFNPRESLNKAKQAKIDLIIKQKQYSKKINLANDKKYNYLFKVARELMWWKNERKDILYHSYYHLDKLIKEISQRLSLTPIQVRHILPQEMSKALTKKEYDPDLLNKRIEHCVIMLGNSKISIYTGKKADILSKKFFPAKKINKNIKKLTGQTAFNGRVKGLVKIINDVKNVNKIKKGDILISEKTVPALISAIKKAAAIVTDQGGITCHAAIIAREMSKPCIIGTKIATSVFQDGDLVEVDANKGIVKKI